ncbi:MAG: glycosyltransferase family 2 protein [Verrucomicrobiota bacterium]
MATSEEVLASVIVVSRNTRELTCAAIRSVFESRDSPAREVVVVDNGSTDNTPAAVSREFPSVSCIRSRTNLGFARANNLGASRARGEFLLLLNSDARLKPDTLAQAMGWMRQHPDCGVAGVQLLNPDGSRQNSIANQPSLATELLNKSLLRRLFPSRFPGKEQRFTEPVEVESVIGACMFIRTSVWRTIGGLDERFFFFLEETDFCRQARARGWKVCHLPQAEAWHGQGQSARQTPVSVRIEYWRSRYAYFRKNSGPLACGMLRAGLCVRLFFDWASSGLLVLATAGRSARWRHRWNLTSALWRWHLSNCPVEMGLQR